MRLLKLYRAVLLLWSLKVGGSNFLEGEGTASSRRAMLLPQLDFTMVTWVLSPHFVSLSPSFLHVSTMATGRLYSALST